MFFRSKKVIGLDIGTSTIKLAELKVSRSGAVLQSFRIAPTPANAVAGGEILDTSQLATAIRLLYNESGSRVKNIATGLWGTSVIVKKITMPLIKDNKAFRDSVRLEAEQYIPFDINNLQLGYSILPSSTTNEVMDVLLVAAQNEIVQQYLTTSENAGLKCKILDVSAFALANCFEFNYGRNETDNIALLNFGSSITNFVVLSKGDIIFTRDIPIGGLVYTHEISKTMGVSQQEAEMLKLSASARQEVPDEVLSVISATNQTVAEEIRNSFDFLFATTNGLNIKTCYITGGTSSIAGLSESVARATGLTVEMMNPFLRIQNAPSNNLLAPHQISQFSAIAMGLALRTVGDA